MINEDEIDIHNEVSINVVRQDFISGAIECLRDRKNIREIRVCDGDNICLERLMKMNFFCKVLNIECDGNLDFVTPGGCWIEELSIRIKNFDTCIFRSCSIGKIIVIAQGDGNKNIDLTGVSNEVILSFGNHDRIDIKLNEELQILDLRGFDINKTLANNQLRSLKDLSSENTEILNLESLDISHMEELRLSGVKKLVIPKSQSFARLNRISAHHMELDELLVKVQTGAISDLSLKMEHVHEATESEIHWIKSMTNLESIYLWDFMGAKKLAGIGPLKHINIHNGGVDMDFLNHLDVTTVETIGIGEQSLKDVKYWQRFVNIRRLMLSKYRFEAGEFRQFQRLKHILVFQAKDLYKLAEDIEYMPDFYGLTIYSSRVYDRDWNRFRKCLPEGRTLIVNLVNCEQNRYATTVVISS
ncbi:MAG: hypothetical protein QM758_30340 [Armatimonas sp.]